jgi:signal transduction histidine kinase
MPGLEQVRRLLESDEWRDLESGLEALIEHGTDSVPGVVEVLDARLPVLAVHGEWRIRRGVARLLAELDRPALLERLAADDDPRVTEAAAETESVRRERAKQEARSARKERQYAQKVEALRARHGDDVAREVEALALERLAAVAQRVGHDLLGTVSTLRRVDEVLRRHVREEVVGKRDWDLSLGSLPRVAHFLESFAEDFRAFLAAPATRQVVTLQELVRSAVADVDAALGAASHAPVLKEVGPTLRAEVPLGDLSRCVANLVKNALEATPTTGTVRVRAWADGANLHIRVADDGKGMSEAMKARCFEPFQTTKETNCARPSGLGLAIVQRKIEEHLGGRVDLESLPGKGTTFTLIIPGVVRA